MEDSDCNGSREEEVLPIMAMDIGGGNVVAAVVDQDHQMVIELSVKEDNMSSLVLANQVLVEQPSIEEKNKSLVVVVAASQEIVESSVQKEEKSLDVLANQRCYHNTMAIAIDASMQNSSCSRNDNPNRQPEDHQLINDNVVVAHADTINWGKLLFEKKLTASDAGDFNRIVIPVKFAKQHFPSVDYTNRKYQVLITFYDIHNKEFKMKYESWPENQMNTLTKGWKHFLRFHSIHVSDMVQFYAGVDHHLQLARADATTKYVYGIHHYREPVISTKTLRFFGQYYIISEKRHNTNEVAIFNEEDAANYRPNGGRKRIRRATSARVTNHEQIEEYNQLVP